MYAEWSRVALADSGSRPLLEIALRPHINAVQKRKEEKKMNTIYMILIGLSLFGTIALMLASVSDI